MNTHTRRARPLLAAAAATAISLLSASAAWPAATIYTWTGTGAGDWSSAANWVGGTVPPSGIDTVLRFTALGTTVVTANNDLSASSPFQMYVMQLSATSTGAQTITGGPLE